MRVCTPRYSLQALTLCSPDHNVTRAWLPLQICEKLKLYFCNVGKTQLRNNRLSPQREHTSVMGAMQERHSPLNLEAALYFSGSKTSEWPAQFKLWDTTAFFMRRVQRKAFRLHFLRNVPFLNLPSAKTLIAIYGSDAFPLCAFFICNIKVNRNLSNEMCTIYQHATRTRKRSRNQLTSWLQQQANITPLPKLRDVHFQLLFWSLTESLYLIISPSLERLNAA